MTATSSGLSTGAAVWLIARREISLRLRSVAFLVSSGILHPVRARRRHRRRRAQREPARRQGGHRRRRHHPGIRSAEDYDRCRRGHRKEAGRTTARWMPPSSPTRGSDRVCASSRTTSAPVGVVQAFSLTPHVELLNPNATPDFLAYLVALGFGLVFFISGMTFGTTIAQSVVEEKSDPRDRDPARRDPDPVPARRQDPRHLDPRVRPDRHPARPSPSSA